MPKPSEVLHQYLHDEGLIADDDEPWHRRVMDGAITLLVLGGETDPPIDPNMAAPRRKTNDLDLDALRLLPDGSLSRSEVNELVDELEMWKENQDGG